VASNGTLLRSEIVGQILIKSKLSGMPELRLGLNDRVQFDTSKREGFGSFGTSLCYETLHNQKRETTSVKLCNRLNDSDVFLLICDELGLSTVRDPNSSSSSAPSLKRAIEMEDVTFHQCVRLNKFETERQLSLPFGTHTHTHTLTHSHSLTLPLII
jgi:AP-1 complex subunit mu